jgi:hypothetical protein
MAWHVFAIVVEDIWAFMGQQRGLRHQGSITSAPSSSMGIAAEADN